MKTTPENTTSHPLDIPPPSLQFVGVAQYGRWEVLDVE